MTGRLKLILALWLLLLGVLQGKSVYTAEPPPGDFLVFAVDCSGPDDLKTRRGIRESEAWSYETAQDITIYAYCHNDPVNCVDVLGLATRRITAFSRDLYVQFFGQVAGGQLFDAFERRSDLYTNLEGSSFTGYESGIAAMANIFISDYSSQDALRNPTQSIRSETTKLSNSHHALIGALSEKTTYRRDVYTSGFSIDSNTGFASLVDTGLAGSVYLVPVFKNYVDRHPVFWIATDTAEEHQAAIQEAVRYREVALVGGLVAQLAEVAPFGQSNKVIGGASKFFKQNNKAKLFNSNPNSGFGPGRLSALPNSVDVPGAKVFSGVFDPKTKNVHFRPSYDGAGVPPPGWVPRQRGHVQVWADEAFESSGQAYGYTIFKQGDGLIVEWKSGLNLGLDASGLLPKLYQEEILEALRKATGKTVRSR